MSEELEASVPEGVTDAIRGVSDDGSTAVSDQGTKVEDLIDSNHRISAEDRVMTELSDDFFSFYGYALDALCLPENSAMELMHRIEVIVGKLCSNIASALTENGVSQTDTSFFYPIPSVTINRQIFDACLEKKSDFYPGVEVLCSNGDTFVYVPIKKYLESRFASELKEFQPNTEYFKSEYFTKHVKPFADEKENTLHILLYSDEFDVCNPIGVARSKHKLFAVYFKVMNFHPRHTSQLQSLHLIMLVKCSTLKSIGIHEVFSPLINELNELYFDGVNVKDVKYYAIANMICGDNLSNNFLGGFSVGFARGMFCRFCKLSGNHVNTHSVTNMDFENRSHVEIVSNSFNKENGMTFVSPFLDLPYVKMPFFFPPDIFHDLFEGVSHLILCTALNDLLKKSIVSLCTINKIFKDNSPFSPAEVKINHVRSGHLPFSGSQMCYWMQYFCAHFGCLFDTDDQIWQLVLCHCEIVEIVTSLHICPDSKADHLRYLITQQNEFLSVLFPSVVRYKCKLHILCHYADLIKLYGSIAFFSTMRFEGVHQYFKRLVRINRNCLNLPKTLCYRFQRHNAVMTNDNLKDSVTCSSTKPFYTTDLDFCKKRELLAYCDCTDMDLSRMAVLSDHIVNSGHHFYCKNKQTVIILSVDTLENDPIFWIVDLILYVKQKWVLLLQKLDCSYEPHFKSYIVNRRLSEFVCTPPSSPLHPPLQTFILGGFLCISLKHIVKNCDPIA